MKKPVPAPKKPKINHDYTWFLLQIFKSPIHRYGVRALEDIPKGKYVIEYTGDLYNRKTSKWLHANSPWQRLIYIWQVAYKESFTWYWIIDGWNNGSGAEFINHSCDPNLEMEFQGRRGFYISRRPIKKGEELTIDYAFAWEGKLSPCSCGSKKCRGYMNKKR